MSEAEVGEQRRSEIEAVLDQIIDPCSVAAGTEIGLLQMGIVKAVEVSGDAVSVQLLPTFPGCIYTAVFAGEIHERVAALGWPGSIKVDIVSDGSLWDEGLMSPEARSRLQSARLQMRQSVQLLRR